MGRRVDVKHVVVFFVLKNDGNPKISIHFGHFWSSKLNNNKGGGVYYSRG